MTWFSEYKRSLKMVEVEEKLDLFLYRPLAFLFVKLIYRTSLTPNQITLLSMLFGIAGALCIGSGDAGLLPLAALLLLAYDVLDCSDGQLARLKQNGTRTGRILDGFADYIVSFSMYLAIAIAYAPRWDTPLLWWLFTALAGFSNAGHSILVDYYRNRFLDVVLQRKSTFEEDLEEFHREYEDLRARGVAPFDRFVIRVYLGYSRLQRRLSSGTGEHSFLAEVDPARYYRANVRMLQFWLLLGPTSQLTYVIIGALLNSLETYVFLLFSAGNILALAFYIAQARINRELEKR
ncbi:MAG: CDP-alcohol phosphatidyltransferase family protein [Bacteroidia bacterium]|nr:CDP-alcohol phosphatidyltransferase family protein [Bacteroidia bacterium]